jgi:acyl carrier protein
MRLLVVKMRVLEREPPDGEIYNRSIRVAEVAADGATRAERTSLEQGAKLEIDREVLAVLDDVLSLKGRASAFGRATPLMNSLPELDSMAVAAVLTSLEERFGFTIADDEVDAAAFATVGSLVAFVEGKLETAR